MGTILSTLCRGIRCDGHDCERGRYGDWDSETFFIEEAVGEGWSVWRGRFQRTYCPDHGPKSGHRMRDVTHLYRDGGAE